MFIRCPGCGEKQWYDTRRQCELCGAVLRRCVDCSCYKAVGNRCTAKNIELDGAEAEHPGTLAVSALCHDYKPVALAA